MPLSKTALKLIDAAQAELIAENGDMEMSGVAKRADVSIGLAYHHFGSKIGLIAAVIDHFYEPLREIALGEAIPKDQHWAERERSRAAAIIGYFYDHPLSPLICGRLGREPALMDIERAHQNALLREGEKNLIQGQRLGVISTDLSPKATIAMLMGGLRLAIDQAVMTSPRPDRDALLDHIWTFTEGALGIQDQRNTSS